MSSPALTSGVQYIPISLEESISMTGCRHASHCLLYTSANSSRVVYGLIQLTDNGELGCPGGQVDVEDVTVDDIIDATNRELEEEINYHLNGVTREDWICSHREDNPPYIQHFFAKELTGDELIQLERTHMNAQHFPSESLGLFRVPIGGSDKKFMTNFLRQRFAGNARQQIIETIHKLSLVSPEDQVWMESIESTGDLLVNNSVVNSGIEVKALLRADLEVQYNDEKVDITYGLMAVTDDGLFDFIGTHYTESDDKNSMIETLITSLDKDLGADWLPIDCKSNAIHLSLDNDSSHVFSVHLNAKQFTQIETHFTECEGFGHKFYGIIRIPFPTRGSTHKPDSVNRFFRGFLNQNFAHNSKQHLKHILSQNL